MRLYDVCVGWQSVRVENTIRSMSIVIGKGVLQFQCGLIEGQARQNSR